MSEVSNPEKRASLLRYALDFRLGGMSLPRVMQGLVMSKFEPRFGCNYLDDSSDDPNLRFQGIWKEITHPFFEAFYTAGLTLRADHSWVTQGQSELLIPAGMSPSVLVNAIEFAVYKPGYMTLEEASALRLLPLQQE